MSICVAPVASFLLQSTVLGGEQSPPSPNKPWYPPQLRKYENQLTHQDSGGKLESNLIELNPKKVYDLPELIDIAERTNPETRIAWERARQAAATVGLSQSAYFPYLVASAGAGY